MGKSIKGFCKKEIVFVIALVAAVISCFFVPPDGEYLSYLDTKTLVCLFCMMLVISALQRTGILQAVSQRMIMGLKNQRAVTTGLVFITFVSSVFIANDMALLTFLPLTIVVLSSTGQQKRAPYIFVLQNIGANLGGMLTPFGNPQNIYLFNYYNIESGRFFRIMAPLFLLSIVLLFVYCCFSKREPLILCIDYQQELDRKRLMVLSLLFILSVLIVFSFIHYLVGLVIVAVTILFLDKKAYAGVDYVLLLTFCAFFIFSGNLARIPAVQAWIASVMEGRELFVGIGMTQVICNVPTAILLSKFTLSYAPLLIAVNIGSFGTMIASLASLITLKTYMKEYQGSVLKYFVYFTLLNLSFLLVLTGAAMVVLHFL